jgi:hypothetical protein
MSSEVKNRLTPFGNTLGFIAELPQHCRELRAPFGHRSAVNLLAVLERMPRQLVVEGTAPKSTAADSFPGSGLEYPLILHYETEIYT